MKKETYIAPTIEIIEFEAAPMMVVLSAAEGDAEIEYTDEEASEDFEVLVNKRRGEWGNLWKEDI